MRWRWYEVDGMHAGGVSCGTWWSNRARCIRWAIMVGVMCAYAMGYAESTVAAVARCPNEEFRTGPSASLPDCRAYELVTPEELGRTQAITFTGSDRAIPSADGEHLALQTYAPLEPNPNLIGTRAVFSRTAQGWTATSVVAPGADAQQLNLTAGEGVLSPELSQVAFELSSKLNYEEKLTVPHPVEVGPVGGPYTLVADIPSGYTTFILGANAGTADVPAFTNVLFESQNHKLLPPGPERAVAEETLPEVNVEGFDLYDWTGGALHLVNVEGEGASVKRLNPCGGGSLGAGSEVTTGPGAVGAVSTDGSKIFFTSPGYFSPCVPVRLYMRLDGRETVEISAPQGVELNPAERRNVNYDGASADGSEVVFNTSTPLLPGETSSQNKLFIYDTETHDLRLIASGGVPETGGTGGDQVIISEDGSAVYYEVSNTVYRYETQTGAKSFIAAYSEPAQAHEPSYTTPNGQFLVFVSGGHPGAEVAGPHGLELESRGAGHNELYRYDAADGSIMCVSCGEGVAPAEGEMLESGGVLASKDATPPFVQMSDNGQKVFFQTTAQLVPQDTNSTSGFPFYPGMDVYEWEADGAEEAPGVVCHVVNGCTRLVSTGEDVGKSTFLGASEDGSNIFFATAAQLVPQATPEFPNIYDARVDGGFAPKSPPRECLSCQGVGSPPPLFNTPASGTFAGAGNPVTSVGEGKPKPKPKPKPKRRRHTKKSRPKRTRFHTKGIKSHKGGGRS
jgi:hypothetical protein